MRSLLCAPICRGRTSTTSWRRAARLRARIATPSPASTASPRDSTSSGRVSGYYLAHPDEPSVYLTSDAVLTDELLEAVERLQPDVIVAPAGAANMGLGGDILFSVDELVTLVRRAPGQVVLNHLEALDHCPTTRHGLRARMKAEGLLEKVLVPEDGEEMSFARADASSHVPAKAAVMGR